ncbi:MAG: hypothetical protein AAFN74_17055, partial [Myxococcota bacterium]
MEQRPLSSGRPIIVFGPLEEYCQLLNGAAQQRYKWISLRNAEDLADIRIDGAAILVIADKERPTAQEVEVLAGAATRKGLSIIAW